MVYQKKKVFGQFTYLQVFVFKNVINNLKFIGEYLAKQSFCDNILKNDPKFMGNISKTASL